MGQDDGMDRLEPDVGTCCWTNDDEPAGFQDIFSTSCGGSFNINEGTPADNGMNFCCYCGKRIQSV